MAEFYNGGSGCAASVASLTLGDIVTLPRGVNGRGIIKNAVAFAGEGATKCAEQCAAPLAHIAPPR